MTDERGALTLVASGDHRVLTERLVEPAIIGDAGRIVVWTDDAARPGSTALRAVQCANGEWGPTRTLVDDGGTPNRIAISPDGARIAYVSTASGLASVWIVGVHTGSSEQLTNRNLQRTPGAAPVGFVEVPHGAAPRFDGQRLVWSARDSEHEVVLP